MKPTVIKQGKAIVEKNGEEPGLLVMTPDGWVEWAKDARTAERILRKWFTDHAVSGSIGVGQIEWRDGLKPASGDER